MDNSENELIKRHSAGATVVPETPFSALPTYINGFSLDQTFLKKWVIPFYMKMLNSVEDVKSELKTIKSEISEEIVTMLLGDFNWRTRSVGAYFAGIVDLKSKTEVIGNLFLKSEVCYAGETYAVALSTLNQEFAIEYFEKYLNYYLGCPQYFFEQDIVLAGLMVLTQNDKDYDIQRFAEMHFEYKKAQNSNPDLDRYLDRFTRLRSEIEEIKSH